MEQIDFKNKRVLVRVDYNVPLDNLHTITDDTRMKKSLPTLKFILEKGGKLIIMSHLGRPQKKKLTNNEIDVEKFSLKHLVNHLSILLDRKVIFSENTVGDDVVSLSNNITNEVLLLENTRFHEEEKKGDLDFAKKLAELGDVYINDAFGTAHRAHASTSVIAQFFDKNNKGAGFLITSELKNAGQLFNMPNRPFTAIVGGAKVSDKFLLLENLIERVDNIIIGGGMAFTFVKANGGSIGNSIVEEDYLELALKIQMKAKEKGVKLLLPKDSITADNFDRNANTKIENTNSISDGLMGLDIGPEAVLEFEEIIKSSKSILWNGPLGVFEFELFSKGTFSIAHAVAEATNSGAFSLIGGGDSVSAINKANLSDQVSFVSTGGGAMLELLEGKILPGIKALE